MQQKTPYKIHFVCHGNTFRSRLAAAYAATIMPDGYEISSSGVRAKRAAASVLEPLAHVLATEHGLAYQLKKLPTQTSAEHLAHADVLVFMKDDVFREAQTAYSFDARKALVWNIDDVEGQLKLKTLASSSKQAKLEVAEPIYRSIKANTDHLMKYLTAANWTDVVDKANKPTGLRLPINWVNDRGLWHRGCHVVVRTQDGKFIVSKRAGEVVFAPGMLEITLGGSLDAGETPLEAAQRETAEELGVLLPARAFRPLFRYQIASYHPKYKKYSRVHLSVYSVTLPLHSERLLRPQSSEVAELRILSKRQLKRLLRSHRLKRFGPLKWDYRLYQKAVVASLRISA